MSPAFNILYNATREELAQYTVINPWFGTLTRGAFDLYLSRVVWENVAVVYFDIDGLKEANSRWGKAECSARIAQALRVRAGDIGTYFSGDEFVMVVPIDDAIGVAKRLQEELHKVGMSATFAILCNALGIETIDAAEEIVSECKRRGKNTIYVDAYRRRKGD